MDKQVHFKISVLNFELALVKCELSQHCVQWIGPPLWNSTSHGATATLWDFYVTMLEWDNIQCDWHMTVRPVLVKIKNNINNLEQQSVIKAWLYYWILIKAVEMSLFYWHAQILQSLGAHHSV